MDEQIQSQEKALKPFKLDEETRPDALVEREAAQSNDPLSRAVVVVAADEPVSSAAGRIASFSDTTTTTTTSTTGVKPPHTDSISNIGQSISRSKAKTPAPPKTPMTPRRLVNFVGGLFLAGITGSFVNPLLTAGIETAFPPQYVRNFHVAQALPDRNLAFLGMHQALTEGQKVEFLSRRFTNLTVSLAQELDEDGRYLEAKTEWAKAAAPSDAASPDLRERKRSYITNEGESEHKAVASLLKNKVDLDVLEEVESSAVIFQKSDVLFHGVRAYEAYLTAGQLAADRGDFERADRNFDTAEMFANSHWTDGASKQSGLIEARWTAKMQEIVASLQALKPSANLPVAHTPSTLTLETRTKLDRYIAGKNWDKLDALFTEAQKKHLQLVDGESVTTAMYKHLGAVTGERHADRINRNTLWEWAENSKSAAARIAIAYWYNTHSERFSDRPDLRPHWSSMRQLYESVNNLQLALVLNPEVAYDPSFHEALLKNLLLRSQISSYEPRTRLEFDMAAVASALTRDDAQLALNTFRVELQLAPLDQDAQKKYIEDVTTTANKIGGNEGDEFYSRAIKLIKAKQPVQIFDAKRYAKGDALISKKFGVPRTS